MRPLEKTIAVRDRRFLLRVETSHESADYRKYEDLREEIWGFPDDHLSSTRNMMCENVFHEGGSLFIGAFAEAGGGGFEVDGKHLVGFCYGFVGVRDKAIGFRDAGNLRFYAQYAGVRKAYQSYGLGILLKEYQREMVLDLLGVSTIICTYDPLTGVNAHRNVHHFGMDVLEYRVATYGEYGGLLNRPDVPTDRFLMSWDLERTGGRAGLRSRGGPGRSGDDPGRLAAGRREERGDRARSRRRDGPRRRGRRPARPHPPRFLPDAPGDGRRRRRREPHPRRLEDGHARGLPGPLRPGLPGRRFPEGGRRACPPITTSWRGSLPADR